MWRGDGKRAATVAPLSVAPGRVRSGRSSAPNLQLTAWNAPNDMERVPPLRRRPLADSIGIFKYEGRYYIETQDRPEPEDAERPEGAELPSVQVLLREHGKTAPVCSLHLRSVPVPVD